MVILSLIVFAILAIASGETSQQSVDVSAPSISVPLVKVMSRSDPTRILIPAIGVDSSLMRLGLLEDGSLEVPPKGFPAGWYTGSPTPGELGPSVIAGHIDWNGPGVFFRLSRMVIGDKIMIERADGSVASFIVIKTASFSKNNFPTELVYGNLEYSGLRLITCGDFDFRLRKYVKDLVVFAKLI